MKSIILKSKKFGEMGVIYDDIDHELISKYHWYIFKNGNGFYAMSTKTRTPNGKAILMHRLILGITDPTVIIDHKNGCGLDNTRSNIRIATSSQNNHNKGLISTNTIGFKGVDIIHRRDEKFYRSRLHYQGKQISLGVWKTPLEAALAYNKKAIELFGEFACINNINLIEKIT